MIIINKVKNMLLNLNNKNIRIHKSFGKLSVLLIVMFIASFINIPFIKKDDVEAQAGVEVENKIDYSGDVDTIKVLEVGPETKSVLNGTTYSLDKLPAKYNMAASNGQKVNVTYVSMPLFISMVDDIEGLYDVVVISKNGSYTNPKSTAKDSKCESTSINGLSSTKEYISENDITNKRADKIINMINKGQLVYMDSGILSSSLNKTKLYDKFNTISNNNFKMKSSSGITIDNIVSDYSSFATKKPKVKQVTIPPESITTDRGLNYTVTAKSEESSKVKIKLYLDANCDGLYTADELQYENIEDSSSDYKDYSFKYMLSKKYIGYLNWKIDVLSLKENDNGDLLNDDKGKPIEGAKTSVIGHVISKAVDSSAKKDINVLQIYPDADTTGIYGNTTFIDTRLDKNSTFMSKIKVDDYNITITEMKRSTFCSKYRGEKGKVDLENEYNMLIIGFADNYNELDFDNYKAIESIKGFIEDGYSVMFTHDTMSASVNKPDRGRCANLTQEMRDYLGQSRYLDPYRYNKASGSYDEKDLIKSYNSQTGLFEQKEIPHDTISYVSLGETKDSVQWEQTYSDKARIVNEAQITDYPYPLKNKDYINIFDTHTQWFQLNLEDEDIVPWYNIMPVSGKSFNSADSRNYYYTYSKGNITYSGTGHRGVNKCKHGGVTDTIPDSELKLFVNTIVKAYKGGNHKPDVENSVKVTESNEEVIENEKTSPVDANRSEDYVFYATPTDEDLDKVKVAIDIEGYLPISAGNVKIAGTDKVYDGGYIPSDTKLQVTIPKDIFKNVNAGEKFRVDLKATDDMEVSKDNFFEVSVGNTPPVIKSYDNSAFVGETIDENKSMVDLCEDGEICVNGTSDLTFTSIPSDIDEDSMNVYVETVGLMDTLNGISEYSDTIPNKDTNDKVSITIPKEYFKYKKKGEFFKVNVTVKDVVSGIEQSSYTETFTIKIGNHTPSLINNEMNDTLDFQEIKTDTDGDGYKNAQIDVNSAKDKYSFMTNVNDIDTTDKLKLTVYCEDSTGEGFNEVASYVDKKPNSDIITAISSKYYEKSVACDTSDENYSKYADKKRGESFKIKTVVEDNNDPSASYEEIFTVKIADNNVPQITPYENDGNTEISNNGVSVNTMAFGKSYDFYAKVNDLDATDDLKVEAFVNNIPTSFTTEGKNLEAQVFKDGDKLKIKIPANRLLYMRDSKITVTLKVTDSYGATSSRVFKVNIGGNHPPVVTNYESCTNKEILNGNTSTSIITIGEPFLFDIIPFDEDDDLLTVKVSIEDGDKINELLPYESCISGDKIQGISIPRAYYSSKFKGDTFKVNVKAVDEVNAVDEKSFNVKIRDDDSTELTNYESNGEDIILDKGTSINNPNVNSIFTKDDLGKYVLSSSLSGDDFNFVTLPKDSDDDFVKIYIKVQVNGEMKLVKAYDNVKANEKLNINIPRSYFKDLRRGDSFKVYVDVSDSKDVSNVFNENPCDSKSFTVKIKDNELPQITNYNDDGTEITDKASLEALKEENYKFKANISDADDKVVKLNVEVEGISLIENKYVDEALDNEIEIPTSYFASLGRGNEFNVTVIVTDEFGGTSTKEFKVKIKNNELPDLDNYTANEDFTKNTLIDNCGDGGVAKTFKDFIFVTVPKDCDDPYVDVNIKADETNILTKENVPQGQDLQVTIPKSIYADKETGYIFKVVVTVTDKNGGSTQKSFTIKVKANTPPIINNYLKKDNIYVGNDTPSKEAAVGKDEIKNNDIVYEKNEETNEGYEFITIPKDYDENDKNNLKVLIKAETKEGSYNLLEKTDAISEKEITVLIPKDIYKNLGKGDSIKITTTVTDLSGESDEKKFDVIINHGPMVINKDSNKGIIEENASVDVTRYHDFNFYSVCNDIDEEDHLNLKVYLEDELINEINLLKDQFGYDASLTIPNEKFNHLNENEKMKVTTVVTDINGKSSKKSFNINMTNSIPTMTNYKADNFEDIESQITNEKVIPSYNVESMGKENAIKQNKYLDFIFVSVVNDSNELEDLNVKITAKLMSQNTDSQEVVLDAKANGVEISSTDSIKSDTRVSATIPQSIYKNSVPGDYVQIVTTVTDEFSKSSSNTFYLQIDDIIPTLNHGVISSENDNGSITVNATEISPRVRTYDTVKFGGIVTDLYCLSGQDAKLKLKVCDGIDVLGDVTVYRILNNNGNILKSNEWKMSYNSSDEYYYLDVSYDKATAIGKIEPEGMTFIIKYNGYIKTQSTTLRRDFVNNLYVNSAQSDANVYTKDFIVDTVPLF